MRYLFIIPRTLRVIVLSGVLAYTPLAHAANNSADSALSQADAAYMQQNYTAARKIWQPLAVAGDAPAQYKMILH